MLPIVHHPDYLTPLQGLAFCADLAGCSDAGRGKTAAAILERMAAVYGDYPVYSYRQEYSDAEPAFAVDQVDSLPTPFKRAAFHYTYSGRWGDLQHLHGKEATTALTNSRSWSFLSNEARMGR